MINIIMNDNSGSYKSLKYLYEKDLKYKFHYFPNNNDKFKKHKNYIDDPNKPLFHYRYYALNKLLENNELKDNEYYIIVDADDTFRIYENTENLTDSIYITQKLVVDDPFRIPKIITIKNEISAIEVFTKGYWLNRLIYSGKFLKKSIPQIRKLNVSMLEDVFLTYELLKVYKDLRKIKIKPINAKYSYLFSTSQMTSSNSGKFEDLINKFESDVQNIRLFKSLVESDNRKDLSGKTLIEYCGFAYKCLGRTLIKNIFTKYAHRLPRDKKIREIYKITETFSKRLNNTPEDYYKYVITIRGIYEKNTDSST